MINLIGTEEKKKLTTSFFLRVLTVLFLLLAFAVFIIVIAILPSYITSVVKKNEAEAKLVLQKKQPVPIVDQTTMALIKDVNGKLGLIENAEKNKFQISEKVIKEIILNKMPDIKITEFSYINDPATGKKISINGIAPSRERLLFFRQALQNDSAFKSVDLPISNFVKGSNIQFYLSLIPA